MKQDYHSDLNGLGDEDGGIEGRSVGGDSTFDSAIGDGGKPDSALAGDG